MNFKSIEMPKILYEHVIEVEERVIPHIENGYALNTSNEVVNLPNNQKVCSFYAKLRI